MATLDETPFLDKDGNRVHAHVFDKGDRHLKQTLAAHDYCNQLAAEIRQGMRDRGEI